MPFGCALCEQSRSTNEEDEACIDEHTEELDSGSEDLRYVATV